jgi:ribosome-associated protein
MLDITDAVRIPESELAVRVSTSSGPGGQNVNRVRTRVTLRFNVLRSGALDEEARQRLLRNLGPRLDSSGNLRVRSQRHRTQARNREEARERLRNILADALRERPARRPTSRPRGADERRLREKRHRAQLREQRSRPDTED